GGRTRRRRMPRGAPAGLESRRAARPQHARSPAARRAPSGRLAGLLGCRLRRALRGRRRRLRGRLLRARRRGGRLLGGGLLRGGLLRGGLLRGGLLGRRLSPAALLHGALERLHEVEHLAALLGLATEGGLRVERVALLELRLDERAQLLLVLVGELL